KYDGADSTKQKFTQKERDNESGLDYFLARYYSSAQGRFTSADEPFVGQDRKDPQSWNLFTYARNNPLLYVDRTGNDYVLYQYDKDGKVINTYQVRDLAALPKGYTVYGGDENITYVKGPDGTLYTAKYVEGDPGGVKVQAQYTISALGDAVGAELDRSADASKKLIGGFAVGTAVVGTGVGGAAYLTGTALAGSSITTLGLSEAGVAPGAAAAESLFVSEATRQAFQRQLAQHGRAALEKSLQSFERRLAEHVTKLELYRKAGGYVSSVEKEIKIFKESIQAIKEILGK
ncbi:MAG: RHS repeat-associated core domain-containing protein, partial [Blastocatellia bacterium]